MLRKALVAAFVLAVIPSVTLAKDPKKPEPLRFDWPVPGKVAVTEVAEKKGKSMKIRYLLELSRVKGSTDIRVHYSGYEFLEFEGKPLDDEMKRLLEPVFTLSSIMPDIRISKEGEPVDVFDIDALIEKSHEMILEVRRTYGVKSDPEEEKAVLAAMKTPAAKELLKARILDVWNAWVGLWVGLDLQPGEMMEGTAEEPMPFGTAPVGHDLIVVNHGAVEKRPGMVKLTYEDSVGGKKNADTVIGEMIEFFKKTPGGAPSSDELKGFESVFEAEVVTDPKTLRPHRVKWKKKVSVAAKGEEGKSVTEKHTYVFDW